MARHRNGPEAEDYLAADRYTPRKPELRTRRAPRSPRWARLCVIFGTLTLLASGTAYAGAYLR